MSVTETPPTEITIPVAEWDRIELLASMQVDALAGHQPGSDALDRLSALEQQVQLLRQQPDSWVEHLADGSPLTPTEANLLVIVIAPLVRGSIAWLYRQMEPDASGRGVAASIIQRILPLEAAEVLALHDAVTPTGRLAREGLLRVRGAGPDARLRPGPVLAERVPSLPPEPDPAGLVRARRVVRFGDLVLARDTLTQLTELVGLVKNKALVESWGGEKTGGPIALFSGPSGVGKTISASAVGGELGWPVYMLDMARIASRWVGVAERRLDKLLDAAHARPMVLVLNEGETFFSRRGEIKEAKDRFANLFVSFLLDRIERHRGPFILTSNLRDNIDQAFMRRFHSVIEFEKPDAHARTELWRRLLPPRAPMEDGLDFTEIGATIALTGGSIRNAALYATHLAAAHEPHRVGPQHLALAVQREIEKRGRRITRRELGCLAEHCTPEDTS